MFNYVTLHFREVSNFDGKRLGDGQIISKNLTVFHGLAVTRFKIAVPRGIENASFCVGAGAGAGFEGAYQGNQAQGEGRSLAELHWASSFSKFHF